MTETPGTTGNLDEHGLYEIRIKGHLDDRWAGWFEGMTLSRDANGETRLTGPVIDQAVLHGLLRKVRNLGVILVAVVQLDANQPDRPGANPDGSHHHSEEESEP